MTAVDEKTDIARHMGCLADEINAGTPKPNEVRWALREGAGEIEQLRAVVRKFCPEIEARKMLTFAAAETVFSAPRRDQ